MKKEGEQLLQSVSPSFHHLNYFFFSFFGDFFPEGKEISILSMSKGGTGMILIGGTGTETFSEDKFADAEILNFISGTYVRNRLLSG